MRIAKALKYGKAPCGNINVESWKHKQRTMEIQLLRHLETQFHWVLNMVTIKVENPTFLETRQSFFMMLRGGGA